MTIGTDILPGIVTDTESLPAVTVGGLSETNVVLVGQGNLEDGQAEPNQPYTVTRSSQVRDYFGSDNVISDAIIDALDEGALPVYAVVTDEAEDIYTASSQQGTLPNAPAPEYPEGYEFDGPEDYEARITYETPEPPDVLEVVEINPVTGEFAFEHSVTDVDITYTTYDYEGALDGVKQEASGDIDYLYALNENETVRDAVEGTVDEMEAYGDRVIAGVGYSTYEDDVTNIEAPYDNSRMQVFYPSRDQDGQSILGAIGGKKATMGINGTTMNKRISGYDRLIDRINQSDQIHLVGESIVPVASESRGALLVDDPTCVSEDNAEESNMADGYSRLVVDRATEIVEDREEPYIGKLNKTSTRASLQTAIRSGLGFLEDQNAVVDYSVRVHKIDAMSAAVDVGVETTKPLRNVYNTISVGQTE